MRRVQTAEHLRGAVTFDPFGSVVASWLRRVGFVLSTSDQESFHLAPAEGMASGAVPMLLDWPGAETIYDPRWVHHSPAGMADAIASIAESDRWAAESALARSEVERYSLDTVAAAWDALLVDVLDGSPALA
jgi:glycosyltransferase involved in cell wall biosynthesis